MKLDFDVILSSYIYQKTNLLMVIGHRQLWRSLWKCTPEPGAGSPPWEKYKKKVYGWSATTVTTPVTVVNIPYGLNLTLINNLLSKWGTITKGTLGYLKETGYKVADGTPPEDGPKGEYSAPLCDWSKKVCLKCTRQGHIQKFCRFQQRTPAASNPSWARIVEEGVSVNF